MGKGRENRAGRTISWAPPPEKDLEHPGYEHLQQPVKTSGRIRRVMKKRDENVDWRIPVLVIMVLLLIAVLGACIMVHYGSYKTGFAFLALFTVWCQTLFVEAWVQMEAKHARDIESQNGGAQVSKDVI